MILVTTIAFSGMPDLVVWAEITLDIALWLEIQDDCNLHKIKQ